jgi:hypothetical protein
MTSVEKKVTNPASAPTSGSSGTDGLAELSNIFAGETSQKIGEGEGVGEQEFAMEQQCKKYADGQRGKGCWFGVQSSKWVTGRVL